jgi:His-Xaa-Ser system protein HxsD
MTSPTPIVAWRLDQAHIAVPVDLSVYSLDAALRAAYKFTDRCFILIGRNPDNPIELLLFLAGRTKSSDLSSVALDLQNELIDQQLRCRLEAQFNDVRTLIVAQAFSEGNLIDPHTDDGDYLSDPLDAGKRR